MSRVALRGSLFGALGAFWLAAGDLGSSWAWVTGTCERLELVVRLFGTLVPMGVLLGAAIGAYADGTALPTRLFAARLAARRGDASERWDARLRPVPLLLVASPALVTIAWLLFTGARASTLPLRPLWVLGAALVLHAGSYVMLRIGGVLLQLAPRPPRRRAAATLTLVLALHVAVTFVDRTVLPGHYPYLHAALTAFGWASAALAFGLLWLRSPSARAIEARRSPRPRGPIALAVAAVLGLLAYAAMAALPGSHVVRVAMLSPRAPAVRGLMLVLGPALPRGPAQPDPAAHERAWRAREERQARSVQGPVLDDAHVLLLTIDALRADHLGTYGYRARPVSAFLDELAASSVVFEQAFAQAPHSSYSITSLMTSEYVQQRNDLGLPLPEETLASALRSVGYHAAAFYTDGIFHTDGEQLTPYRRSRFGFGRVSHRHIEAEAMTDEVLGEVGAIVEAGEPPSFVWAHYFDVHEPYQDTSFGARDVDRYDGEIRNVDRALARLIRSARERLTRPLVVVVTADHGEEFGDHGGVYHGSTLYQEQIRVPLIIHVPDLAPRRVPTPVELVDVAPTLLALVGAPVPTSMRGDDLRPLLDGQALGLGPAFASVNASHMAVDWPHKLVVDLRYGTQQLFDLVSDPRERRSLADERRDVVERLQGELSAWIDSLAEAEDPHLVALRRGRLADRGAAPGLAALLTDERAEPAMRVEAARLLATIPHPAAIPSLNQASRCANADVAREALITLAWRGASGPREPLHALLESDEDEARRMRAAIGLGRVGDRAAVPTLGELIEDEDAELDHRVEAVRLLGVLRDPRGVGALLGMVEDERLRRRVLVALGRVGDPRAFDTLLEALTDPRHTVTREFAARALGELGDARAVPFLVSAVLREPLPSAAESLVRLGAVGGPIGGIELGPEARAPGLSGCRSLVVSPADEAYLDRTYCELTGSARVTVSIPEAVRAAPSVVLLLRGRRTDGAEPVALTLRSEDHVLGGITVENAWAEDRLHVAPGLLSTALTLELAEPAARVALDHLLLLPSVP